MKTIIELFDNETMLNVIAACSFQPENVVFVGEFRHPTESLEAWIRKFLQARNLEMNVYFVDVNSNDCSEVIEVLTDLYERFPDCVLEITGGGYIPLLAAGMFAESVDIPIFHFDLTDRCFRSIRNCDEADGVRAPQFTSREVIELTSASIKSYNHVSTQTANDASLDDIRRIWYIYLEHKQRWGSIVLFFQNAQEVGPLEVDSPRRVSPNNSYLGDKPARRLEAAGLICDLKMENNRISFKYKNELTRTMLRTAGAPLEMFTYTSLTRSTLFSDCEIDLQIDWDGDGPSDTENEIDVVAVRGITPLFISCKSGRFDTKALNELDTLSRKLGGRFAKPVLMTAELERSGENYRVMERAADMGIEVIGMYDICTRFDEENYHGMDDCLNCTNRECERNFARLMAAIADEE